ncbi:alpha-glucuronidase [Chryseobacterium defluvii]|uniref:Alpha-glucuronidase n=1 Tax=Chryseobacterium defluvii TaxID=160396 RepID=A0A840KC83_9FLAO|nr:hypothetical protein [Chryseobacterium defluvii]MBB4807069.1 alpha-glucuronidase [Chryseobacterium defluvii]
MTPPELQPILRDYITLICKEQGLTSTKYNDNQWEIMTENIGEFVWLCDEDINILLFFYVWYNHRDIYQAEVIWENILKDGKIPKEQFDRMCQSWASLENNIIQFTKENQKTLETLKNKQQDNDLDHER